jgi:hypothetical protein
LFPCMRDANESYEGDACCISTGSPCAGTVTTNQSFFCAGECPEPEVCLPVGASHEIIKLVETCSGGCATACFVNNVSITRAWVMATCECGSPDEP